MQRKGSGGGDRGGRWRFFQLSADGSALRWDWDKYVLMFHVESVACDDEALLVTLSLTLDPDLRLAFPSRALYDTWLRGLRALLRALLSPEGLEYRRPAPAAAARGAALTKYGSGGRIPPFLPPPPAGGGSGAAGASPRKPPLLRLGSTRACVAAGGLGEDELTLAADAARAALAAQGSGVAAAVGAGAGGSPKASQQQAQAQQLRRGHVSISISASSVARPGPRAQIGLPPPPSTVAALPLPRRGGSGVAEGGRLEVTPPRPRAGGRSWLRRTMTLPARWLGAGSGSGSGPAGTAAQKWDSPTRAPLFRSSSTSSGGSSPEGGKGEAATAAPASAGRAQRSQRALQFRDAAAWKGGSPLTGVEQPPAPFEAAAAAAVEVEVPPPDAQHDPWERERWERAAAAASDLSRQQAQAAQQAAQHAQQQQQQQDPGQQGRVPRGGFIHLTGACAG